MGMSSPTPPVAGKTTVPDGTGPVRDGTTVQDTAISYVETDPANGSKVGETIQRARSGRGNSCSRRSTAQEIEVWRWWNEVFY